VRDFCAAAYTISDRYTVETTTRLIIENGLQNVVTTFQRFAEALYARHPSAPAARRNAFQNLAGTSGAQPSAKNTAHIWTLPNWPR
jgi:hypothetical protein